VIFVRDFLKQEGLSVSSEDVGSDYPRHVQYFPMSGRVRVRNLTPRADIATQEQQFLKRIETAPVAGEIDLF
jgi:chemotaxis protein CheD